eukprot:749348-Alexandrium_andersonii.AAC.1
MDLQEVSDRGVTRCETPCREPARSRHGHELVMLEEVMEWAFAFESMVRCGHFVPWIRVERPLRRAVVMSRLGVCLTGS